MSKKAYVSLIILTALLVMLLLFIGYLIWGETWQVPTAFKYDILKDTLTIVLIVTAVVIAVAGSAIYLIMSERLKRESSAASRLEVVKGSVRLSIVLGFAFWEAYESASTGEKEAKDLEMAIRLTCRALIYHDQLPETVAHDRENEREFCLIKNNLAYYFAWRKRAGDREIAREYAEYIHGRMPRYAEERDNWQDTYNFVKQQYPD